MALGGPNSRPTQASPEDSNPINEKKDEEAALPNYDPERALDIGGGRRMSRVAPPKKGSMLGGQTSDTESDLSIGAQIELEKDNAIKYRTCSWRKV